MTLLLDSGAFSALKKGTTIEVRDYIKFVRQHGAAFDHHINLDVIPGRGIDRDRAAEESYRNLQVMKETGLRPWPVFHQGEDFKWLERILHDGDPYICISPEDGPSTGYRRAWIDQCFRIIGSSEVRVHGLGVSSLGLVAGFPWSSLDSSTWVQQGGHGKIPVPRRDAAWRADYTLPPVIVGMTDDLPGTGHVDAMSVLSHVRRHLDDSGSSLEEARYSHSARYALWALYISNMVAANSDAVFYFATGDGGALQYALDRAGARHRLASYWWLRDKPDEGVRRFAEARPSPPPRVKPRWASKSYKAHRALALHHRFNL